MRARRLEKIVSELLRVYPMGERPGSIAALLDVDDAAGAELVAQEGYVFRATGTHMTWVHGKRDAQEVLEMGLSECEEEFCDICSLGRWMAATMAIPQEWRWMPPASLRVDAHALPDSAPPENPTICWAVFAVLHDELEEGGYC